MPDIKRISELEIANSIRVGKIFYLSTNAERRDAYQAAKFAGKTIKVINHGTKKKPEFEVKFCQ